MYRASNRIVLRLNLFDLIINRCTKSLSYALGFFQLQVPSEITFRITVTYLGSKKLQDNTLNAFTSQVQKELVDSSGKLIYMYCKYHLCLLVDHFPYHMQQLVLGILGFEYTMLLKHSH
jgi:hypothetical protein